MNTTTFHPSHTDHLQTATGDKPDFWAFHESNDTRDLPQDSHAGMRDRKQADEDPEGNGSRRWAAYVAFFTMVFASMAAAATVAGSDLPLLIVSL